MLLSYSSYLLELLSCNSFLYGDQEISRISRDAYSFINHRIDLAEINWDELNIRGYTERHVAKPYLVLQKLEIWRYLQLARDHHQMDIQTTQQTGEEDKNIMKKHYGIARRYMHRYYKAFTRINTFSNEHASFQPSLHSAKVTLLSLLRRIEYSL
jgi:hypothetical protein